MLCVRGKASKFLRTARGGGEYEEDAISGTGKERMLGNSGFWGRGGVGWEGVESDGDGVEKWFVRGGSVAAGGEPFFGGSGGEGCGLACWYGKRQWTVGRRLDGGRLSKELSSALSIDAERQVEIARGRGRDERGSHGGRTLFGDGAATGGARLSGD